MCHELMSHPVVYLKFSISLHEIFTMIYNSLNRIINGKTSLFLPEITTHVWLLNSSFHFGPSNGVPNFNPILLFCRELSCLPYRCVKTSFYSEWSSKEFMWPRICLGAREYDWEFIWWICSSRIYENLKIFFCNGSSFQLFLINALFWKFV